MDEKVLGSTVRIDLTTHDSTGALVAPSSTFAAADFRIYKDGSASEKTTTNGITVTSPFDSITGKHLIEIDTNNSTGDSGFWAAGSEYRVEINSAKTVASIVQTGVTIGRFRLVSADVLRSLGTNAPVDWLNAAAVKADAVTKIQNGLSTATNVSDSQTAVIAQIDANETKIDAVKAKTDNLPSNPADESIIIAATDAILTAVGTRSTQTSVDDLPTNTELATALASSDDATLAAIAGVQSDTNDIQARLPATLEGGRIPAVLDTETSAKIDAIPKVGSTHRYTQIAQTSTTTDVAIGEAT